MSVPDEECDICGAGSPSDGLRLCARCEALEEECDGDIGKVGAIVEERNRREAAALLGEAADELRRRGGMSQTWAEMYREVPPEKDEAKPPWQLIALPAGASVLQDRSGFGEALAIRVDWDGRADVLMSDGRWRLLGPDCRVITGLGAS